MSDEGRTQVPDGDVSSAHVLPLHHRLLLFLLFPKSNSVSFALWLPKRCHYFDLWLKAVSYFSIFFCKSMFTAMGSLVVVFFSRNLQILGSDVDVDRMPTMISLRWKQTNKQTSQKSKQKQNVARRLTELKLISNFQVNQSARLIGETGQPIREAFCFLFDFWKWFWSIGFVGAYAALDYLHGRLLQRRTHQMIKEKEREREREKDKKKKEDKFFVFLLFFVFSVPEKKIPSR